MSAGSFQRLDRYSGVQGRSGLNVNVKTDPDEM